MDESAAEISLTESELSLLATVTEDGFPLRGLAATLSGEQVDQLKADALQLLAHGLIGVYSRTEDANGAAKEKARAVLLSSDSWLAGGHGPAWFIATTAMGDALLAARGLGMLRRPDR